MKKNYSNILGIHVAKNSRKELEQIISQALSGDKTLFLTTPNPEIILSANQDEELHHILNQADLNIADGVGLEMAGWLMGLKIERWPGSDITCHLLEKAEKEKKKVALVSWTAGLSTKAEIESALKTKYPQLDFLIEEVERAWSLAFYQAINLYKPDILLVGLGSPYQEKFIFSNLVKMKYLKIAIGVGGTFDYLSGKVRPAPKVLKKLGLEWLWRLINIFSFKNPIKRLKRIYKATIVFPLKFLKWFYLNPFIYRKNVACLMYKKVGEKIYIFLLKNKRYQGEDHWQIPQGGIDGEKITDAGLRELQEETGTYEIKAQKSVANVHKYLFENDRREFRNYKGQSQSLLIAEYYGKNDDFKLNYWEYDAWKWVELDRFVETVHPVRREAAEKFILLFREILNSKS